MTFYKLIINDLAKAKNQSFRSPAERDSLQIITIDFNNKFCGNRCKFMSRIV